MKTRWMTIAAAGLLTLGVGTVFSQPPDQREPKGPRPPARRAGMPPNGRPGPWEPGKVMPPHVREQLQLSEDQNRQLADLEKEVKERILKILTTEQKKQLRELRPPGPPPEDGEGRPPRRGLPGPPDDDQGRRPPPGESEP